MPKSEVAGLWGSSKSYYLRKILGLNDNVVVVCENRFEMEKIKDEITFFFPEKEVLLFPEYQHEPFDEVRIEPEILSQRIKTLYSLTNGEKDGTILLSTLYSLTKTIFSKEELVNSVLQIEKNSTFSMEELHYFMDILGYVNVEVVSDKGEYLVRGDIFEIFPAGFDYPVRVEFFDDEIEQIYTFDYEKLIKKDELESIIILPANEIICETDILVERIEKLDVKEKIREFGKYGGIHWLMPLVNTPVSVFDYISDKFKLVFMGDDFSTKIDNFYFNIAKTFDSFDMEISFDDLFLNKQTLLDEINERESLFLSETGNNFLKGVGSVGKYFVPSGTNAYENSEKFARCAKHLLDEGFQSVVVFQNERFKELFEKIMTEHDISTNEINSYYEIKDNVISVFRGAFTGGFVDEGVKFALFTESEIFGFVKKKRKKKKEAFKTSIADLEVGDFVVHIDYGIGKYLGIEVKEIAGIKGDYIKVEFADKEILYIPVANIGFIQKYVGIQGSSPRLSSLKTNRWKKLKEQAYKSAKKLAVDILKIYAERKNRKGYPFVNEGEILREVEARFPYSETEDQIVALNDVYKDMESDSPMERLICGDVGFGKTEIAIRSAAKAVESGKQVALLAPTTVLVRQHYNNFVERFEGLPVNIEYVSRMKSAKEIKAVLERLKKGEVDIVIGTHRLLSKDVEFSDLGLLIIDEEQRFGVNHKEKIKALKTNVDVLTLTATPIPRTLQLSLSGLRDMSVIETPPQDRAPVSLKVIKDEREIEVALQKELKRGGQVYFLHNNVENIEEVAAYVKKMVPLATVGVAHGKMDSNSLSKVFDKFYQGDLDVLVCTTIIENGLDVPNANTIIINDAQKFGLSQLYQLKGRVGRSNKRGYCYLKIPKNLKLSDVSKRRLKIIQQLSDLGSGFKISMHDLQLRGAGDLLGAEQSGFVVNIGYELYIQMINEAINELRGKETTLFETEIVSSFANYIPASFIPSHRERIQYYRIFAEIDSIDELAKINSELSLLYGNLPIEVVNLGYIMILRNLLSKLKVEKCVLFQNSVTLNMAKDTDFDVNLFLDMLKDNDLFTVSFKGEYQINIFYKGNNFLKDMADFFENYSENYFKAVSS